LPHEKGIGASWGAVAGNETHQVSIGVLCRNGSIRKVSALK